MITSLTVRASRACRVPDGAPGLQALDDSRRACSSRILPFTAFSGTIPRAPPSPPQWCYSKAGAHFLPEILPNLHQKATTLPSSAAQEYMPAKGLEKMTHEKLRARRTLNKEFPGKQTLPPTGLPGGRVRAVFLMAGILHLSLTS